MAYRRNIGYFLKSQCGPDGSSTRYVKVFHPGMGWWLGTRGIFRHSDMMQILLISLPQVTAHINGLAVLVPLPPEPA